MPFTVKDFRDLLRILEKHPEWRAELRRVVLTEELLALPELVRELIELHQQMSEQMRALAEAQLHTEERMRGLEEQVRTLAEAQRRTETSVHTFEGHVRALVEAQRRSEEEIRALSEAQHRTEERVEALEEQVRALAEAQRRTEEEVRTLVEAQRRTEEEIRALTEAQRHAEAHIKTLTDKMGEVQGYVLEWRYREHAPAYFDDLLRRIHVLSSQELAALLDDSVDKGLISRAERKDVLMSDIVIRGRRQHDDAEAYLVVEVSAGVGEEDVERAVKRAEVLRRALDRPVLAAVAGRGITPEASARAREHGVWRIVDGTPIAPTEES